MALSPWRGAIVATKSLSKGGHIDRGDRLVGYRRDMTSQADWLVHEFVADGRPVKHFPEIAEAGGGRCISLGPSETGSLIVEIAGLTLGDRFGDEVREFFRAYLELGR